MTKKLYQTTIEITGYVVAETVKEAQQIFKEQAPAPYVEAVEANEVAANWLDLIPYGGDDDELDCQEWLELMQRESIGDIEGERIE